MIATTKTNFSYTKCSVGIGWYRCEWFERERLTKTVSAEHLISVIGVTTIFFSLTHRYVGKGYEA